MPVFKYKAKKGVNEIIEGSISAQNQAEALNKLMQQQIFPIEVEPVEEKGKTKESSLKEISAKIFKKKISSKDILIFTQKLATLSRAKMELLPSLKVLYEQAENPEFKTIILKIHNDIKEGSSFSDGLAQFPEVFPSLFVSIVKAGEATGAMDKALTQLASFIQTQESLKGKVLGALVYPGILSCIGVASVFVILNFVVPRLKAMFTDLGTDIPLMTKIILQLSDFTTKYGLGIVLVVSVVLLIISLKGGKVIAKVFKWFGRRLPVVKDLLRNQELASFSQAFSLLIGRGVAPLQSLEIASLSIKNEKTKKELKEATAKIRQGQRIHESMSNFKSLPDFFIKMIEVGEQSGRLGEVLDEVADSYNRQIDSDVGLVTSVLEPLLILFIGLILGGIVLAILLPIFEVTQMIR